MANLYKSCRSGNFLLARKQLQRGADVNYHQTNETCLIAAVTSQNEELVSLLLEQPGIDVNAKGVFGTRALHRAAGRLSTPDILRQLLDFPGIDREAKTENGRTPLMEAIVYGTASHFVEFLKTPAVLLNDGCLPGLLEGKPELQNMFDALMFAREQRKRENGRQEEKTKREEEKNKEKGQKRKRETFNEAEKWKEMKLARRRQKAAVEELIKKNKEAEEEISKEGRMIKERVEMEFQDKIDALAREITILENEKQKRIVQVGQEQVERQETLSKENQAELNNLVKKHKAENIDMLEKLLDKEDDEDGEDAPQGGEQQVNIAYNVEHVFKDENGREVRIVKKFFSVFFLHESWHDVCPGAKDASGN